ncbi:hypothetical protein WJX72_001600 [[Myrmecia] bisecta]|uniref:Calponin-homology (CH) domain-containing protein n=1 Tax=[Myrmecia] bisecta TaxID=41462 RepID=A0AAW1R4Y9_9CHLO
MPAMPSLMAREESQRTAGTFACLIVSPTQVNLTDIAGKTSRATTITVLNKDHKVRTLRVNAPSTKFFSLRGCPSLIRVAPGLEAAFQVVFEGGEEGVREYHDSLTVRADNGERVEVGCHAWPPQPRVHVEGNLNVGTLMHETLHQRCLQLVNTGNKGAAFQVEADASLPISISPTSGQLGPAGSASACCQLRVDIRGEYPGGLAGQVCIRLEGEAQPISLDFAATVVANSFELLDPDGAAVSQVDFGSVHYGDERVLKLSLLNAGPREARFMAAYGTTQEFADAGEGSGNAASDDPLAKFMQAARMRAQRMQQTDERPFTLFPTSGVIPAYKHVEVTVRFHARGSASNKGFTAKQVVDEEHYSYLCQVQFDGCPIRVTFCPHALGPHKCRLAIQVKGKHAKRTIWETTLHVSGTCDKLGPPVRLVGGVQALPEHFEKPARYVDQDEVALAALTKKGGLRRPPLWEMPEVVQRFQELPAGRANPNMLSLEDLKKKVLHREKYSEFLKEHRMKKAYAETARNEYADTLNMGMDPYKGYRRPALPQPLHSDPLWLNSASQARPCNRPALPEELVEAIAIFKDKPADTAETQQCNEPLNKEALAKLAVGPRVLDFGRISASSRNLRHLFVTNPLTQHVHILVATSGIAELAASEHVSQVIPPGATAKFPIGLCVPHVTSFHQTVEYVVNACQIFSFEVRAEVVPVALDLSTSELSFNFGLDNWQPHVDEVLIMSNAHPFPAEFKWVLSEGGSMWSCSPMEGSVRANSSQEVLVRWAPAPDAAPGDHQARLTLKLKGGDGPEQQVRLQALLPEGKLAFKDKVLDFGAIPVGRPQTRTIVMRNQGSYDAIFQVLPNDQLRCMPDRGRLAPGSMFEVEVTLNALQAQTIQSSLAVEVRGGGAKPLKLPVLAQACMPAVSIQEPEFNFGDVYIGVAARLPLTIINTTAVPAGVHIDLISFPEFSLELPKEAWSPDDYDECPLMQSGRRGSAGSSRSSRRHKVVEAEEGERKEGARYLVQLAPSKSLAMWLVFKAVREGQHTFNMAFTMTGYGQDLAGAELSRRVAAGGLRARLLASKTGLDFGKRIVVRSNQQKLPYCLELQLANDVDHSLQFEFGPASSDSAEGCRGVFSVEPKAATLVQGASCTARILFSPKDDRSYSARLPLFLDGNLAQAYLEIDLKGEGQYPRLTFDVNEVILPAVPLGIRAEARFHVINDGYDNLELKVRLPADEAHLPLQLTFPEGNLIGIAKEKLPVVVTFSSGKPTSFTTAIDFLDDDSARTSLPVTAIADASLLTIKPFLDANAGELLWRTSEGGPVVLDDSVDYSLPEGGLTSMGPTIPSPHCARFLHATTLKGLITSLPSAVLSSKGRLMLDFVENFSGKPVPGKVGSLASSRKEASSQLLAQAEALLAFLKSHGALLNTVKPELLLDLEDFRSILAKRDAKASTAAEQEAVDHLYDLEDDFDVLSFMAWNAVMFQVLKVFVLSRATPRSLRSLPGMDGCMLPPEATLLGSNVHSVAESVLLAWMTAHFRKALPEVAVRVVNFDTDLKSGLVLYSLMVNHWPDFARVYGPRVKTTPKGSAQQRENIGLVISMMETLQIPYNITVEELQTPDAREMLIFILYLYLTLPHFIPQGTIDFTSKLCEKQVKQVQLSNPSGKVISYAARLEGHADFGLETTSVKLEPKAAAQFAVTCKATTTNPQAGRLILSSKRDGTGQAATLVFNLRSTVDCRGPLKRVRTEGPLYELVEFDVKVNNPFPADCDFVVTVVQSAADSLDLERLREGEVRPVKEAVRGKAKLTKRGSMEGHGAAKPSSPASTLTRPGQGKLYPDAFGMDKLRLRVKANAEETIRGIFLPFMLGTHVCSIIFEDINCGKFVYEVSGEARLPQPLREYKFQVGCDGAQVRDLSLAWPNPQLEAAKRTFLERHPLAKHKEQAALVKPEGDASSAPATTTFDIEQSSTRIELPETLTMTYTTAAVPHDAKAMDKTPTSKEVPQNTLRMMIQPVGPGLYPTRILLLSPHDVRVLDVEIAAKKLGQAAVLELECAARSKLVQEVPIVNSSSGAMTVVAECKGEAFSGPKELHMAPGQLAAYPLTFKPPWVGSYAGTLEITVPSTGEKNLYSLVGLAEEPVAEGHLVVECQARTPLTKKLLVPNILAKKALDYRVSSDLDCVSGKEGVHVELGGSAAYSLHILPARPGIIMGSINFAADTGQYVWFALELHVSEAPPVASLELGNFSYLASLHASPAPPEPLPALECALGGRCRGGLAVRNPTGEEVVLEGSSSNPEAFTFTPELISLPPFGLANAHIEYTPGSLDVPETGMLSLSHPSLGVWQYECVGRGLPPSIMDATQVVARLGQEGTCVLNWRNPYPDACKVDITLVCPPQQPAVFNLLLKKGKGLAVAGFATLQIPLTFLPISLEEAHAEVQVQPETNAPQPLVWRFPIQGVAEAETQGAKFKLTCPVRSRLVEVLPLPLEGLGKLIPGEQFEHELIIPSTKEAALRHALSVTPVLTMVTSPLQPLQYQVVFEPQKAMSARIELVVRRPSGGRWRFEVRLDATKPDVDGQIRIEAMPGQAVTAPLHIYSTTDQPTTFTAHFTHDSSIQFDVFPAQGVLPVEPGAGQAPGPAAIYVQYSAHEYGKVPTGKLIILTDDTQMTYSVQGVQPAYQPPDKAALPLHVDNRLRPDTAARLQQTHAGPVHKNFLLQNMKGSRKR